MQHGPFGQRYYAILYAIEAPAASMFKIGRTIELEKRFAGLSASSPVPLILRGSVWLPDDAEASAHVHLHEHRAHGEWFVDAPKVREFVEFVEKKRVIDLSYVLEMDRMLLRANE